MTRLIGQRLLKLGIVLFLVSLATFFLVDLVPGDPAVAVLGSDATAENIERVRTQLGLDQPLVQRYGDWLGSALQGDLGDSLLKPAFTVTDLVRQSLPITLQLAIMGLLIAVVVAVPAALWAAYRQGSTYDRATNAATSALISIPSFVAALLLAFLFVFHPAVPRFTLLGVGLAVAVFGSYKALQAAPQRGPKATTSTFVAIAGFLAVVVAVVVWFPEFNRTGFVRLTSDDGLRANLRSAFLPALTIALTEIAIFTRLLRSDLISTLQEDFILAAKAKGVTPGRILFVQALRPSSFSLITLFGVSLGRAIGGTVIVETVFGIQGIGRLVVNDGVVPGDYPIVQGGVLVIAVFYVLINLAVDISYLYLDPRVRHGA